MPRLSTITVATEEKTERRNRWKRTREAEERSRTCSPTLPMSEEEDEGTAATVAAGDVADSPVAPRAWDDAHHPGLSEEWSLVVHRGTAKKQRKRRRRLCSCSSPTCSPTVSWDAEGKREEDQRRKGIEEEVQKLRRQKKEEEAGGLKILQTIEPENVNNVSMTGEWEEIDMAVDSGATETVVGEDMVCSVAIEEGEASRRGVKYEVATGVQIPNLGEKKFEAVSEEGVKRGMTA